MLYDSPQNAEAPKSLCDLYYRHRSPARGNEHCKKALIAAAHDDDIQSSVASIYIRKSFVISCTLKLSIYKEVNIYCDDFMDIYANIIIILKW